MYDYMYVCLRLSNKLRYSHSPILPGLHPLQAGDVLFQTPPKRPKETFGRLHMIETYIIAHLLHGKTIRKMPFEK